MLYWLKSSTAFFYRGEKLRIFRQDTKKQNDWQKIDLMISRINIGI